MPFSSDCPCTIGLCLCKHIPSHMGPCPVPAGLRLNWKQALMPASCRSCGLLRSRWCILPKVCKEIQTGGCLVSVVSQFRLMVVFLPSRVKSRQAREHVLNLLGPKHAVSKHQHNYYIGLQNQLTTLHCLKMLPFQGSNCFLALT